MASNDESRPTPVRRPPPPFRRVTVRSIDEVTPRMKRVVVGGPELDGLVVDQPASSIRLLLPPPGTRTLVMPEWTGNQFELPDGSRAPIRTFTPRFLDTDRHALTIDVVVHDAGAAIDWVRAAEVGDEVAVSGPGRGEDVDTDAAGYLLVGDETAIPAMSQLLAEIPDGKPVAVHVEIAGADACCDLPGPDAASVEWHLLGPGAEPGSTLVAAVESLPDIPDFVWVAAEAAAVQKIRKHLFGERGRDRKSVTVRGYWKHGRSAT